MSPGPQQRQERRFDGLSRAAFVTYEAAQARTAWAVRHRRRVALVASDYVLAGAEVYDLTGRLDGQLVSIRGIAAAPNGDPGAGASASVVALVEQLVDEATRQRVDLALLFPREHAPLPVPGFVALPTTSVRLTVTESVRHGAPMVLVRGGEPRDLQAIAAMGRVRANGYRFHLARDVDLIAHAITRTRLLAGLAPPGTRRLEFVIAEEGITAAAYVVITVAGDVWTIEECGDRDPSGARVGALLQALIAREPAEARPVIRGWLPPGFRPPQVAVAPETPAAPVLLARALSPRIEGLRWSAPDVLYWLDDLF